MVVRDNEVEDDSVTVDSTSGKLSLIMNRKTIIQIEVGDDTDEIILDLRPIGLNIQTDENALYIGWSLLSGNRFTGCKTAIAIG